jgi:hypothetical protein
LAASIDIAHIDYIDDEAQPLVFEGDKMQKTNTIDTFMPGLSYVADGHTDKFMMGVGDGGSMINHIDHGNRTLDFTSSQSNP